MRQVMRFALTLLPILALSAGCALAVNVAAKDALREQAGECAKISDRYRSSS
jgi:hypothetical protein